MANGILERRPRVGGPRRGAAATIAWALVGAAMRAQTPEFVDGDPAALTATLVSVVALENQNAFMATVKVVNRGPSHAEPLTFEAAPKAAKTTARWRRCPGPYVGRCGRGVAPGGEASYPLFVRGDAAAWQGASIRVVDAAFSSASLERSSPVEVGGPEAQKSRHASGASVDVAVVPLRNTSTRTVDVLLKLRYEQPSACEGYAVRRLEPGASATATFTGVEVEPPSEAYSDPSQTYAIDFVAPHGARLAAASIADWIEIVPAGEGAAAAAVAEVAAAYDSWLQWEDRDGVTGEFEGVHESAATGRVEVKGEFTEISDGTLLPRYLGKPPPEARQAVHVALQAAFENLRRPPTPIAMQGLRPRLVRAGPVRYFALDGPPWHASLKRQILRVANGRIVGHGFDTDPLGLRTEWSVDAFEGGYLVFGRRSWEASTQSEPTVVESWRFARRRWRVVPTTYAVKRTFVTPGEVVLRFDKVRPIGAPGSGPRAIDSPAARALAVAWENGYRYPATGVSYSARFAAKCGKDGLWLGRKEVTGALEVDGFRGEGWSGFRVRIDGEPDGAVRGTLSQCLEDRFRMWSGRDFACRPSFDEAFADAAIVERDEPPGVFDASRGPYRTVTVRDGRVAALTFRDGRERRLEWRKVGDVFVAVAAVTPPEECRAEFRSLGGFLVPSRMTFKGVFGDEKSWGTEELKLADLKKR